MEFIQILSSSFGMCLAFLFILIALNRLIEMDNLFGHREIHVRKKLVRNCKISLILWGLVFLLCIANIYGAVSKLKQPG